jgi:carbon storage regulator
MLVLSRQRDETIMIGDEIEISVVDIRGDKVRLGITAPTRIAVHRKEVYDAIRAENERAARMSGDLVLHRTLSPGPARTRPIRCAAAALAQNRSLAGAPLGPQSHSPPSRSHVPLAQGLRTTPHRFPGARSA